MSLILWKAECTLLAFRQLASFQDLLMTFLILHSYQLLSTYYVPGSPITVSYVYCPM